MPLLLCRHRDSLDGAERNWNSATSKVRAANYLTDGRLAAPQEDAEQDTEPAPAFELDFVALDMGLHFVEVKHAQAQELAVPVPNTSCNFERLRSDMSSSRGY